MVFIQKTSRSYRHIGDRCRFDSRIAPSRDRNCWDVRSPAQNGTLRRSVLPAALAEKHPLGQHQRKFLPDQFLPVQSRDADSDLRQMTFTGTARAIGALKCAGVGVTL